MFETSPVFPANFAATKHKVVNQGGTSSGKTYAILQVLFVLLAATPNLVCTVVGQDIPNLKKGAMRDAETIVGSSPELRALLQGDFNKSDRIYTYRNGSLLEFTSYENWQDAKSGKRDYLFVNEANGIAYSVVKELVLRTRIRCFFDYNPNAEFWIHDKVIGKPDAELIISDHRHNPFLPQQIRDGIEGLKEEDEELWKVYARGLTGRIEGLVLRNWTVWDGAIPAGAKYLGTGLDFGFTNDPTTAVSLYLSGGQLWADELLYQTGLTNPDILAQLKACRPHPRFDVVADSAEPKSVEELRRAGLLVEGALKGPDSVNASLEQLRRYHLNVTRASVNLRKELSNYKWRVDRLTGKATNQPVDAFNHCIDALRYVALNRLPKATERRRRSAATVVIR